MDDDDVYVLIQKGALFLSLQDNLKVIKSNFHHF